LAHRIHIAQANVLIDSAHRARITDFGLSKVKSSMTTQTMADVWEKAQVKTPGTRAFMAPERLRRGTMNFATDVYAFAMSAYQVPSPNLISIGLGLNFYFCYRY